MDGSDAAPAVSDTGSVLTLLQGYLARTELPTDGRLPPERDLATDLGVSRAALRGALAALEHKGELWRHVGKGTFLGARPIHAISDVATLARRSSPASVMEARLALEPELARLAALHATERSTRTLRDIQARMREPGIGWRPYEGLDAQFHRLVARGAGNLLLLHVFDTLSAVRRAVTWARPRHHPHGPPPDHHSLAEHEVVLDSIVGRDPSAAAEAMRTHLITVMLRLTAE